jgi:hypothetical protein
VSEVESGVVAARGAACARTMPVTVPVVVGWRLSGGAKSNWSPWVPDGAARAAVPVTAGLQSLFAGLCCADGRPSEPAILAMNA